LETYEFTLELSRDIIDSEAEIIKSSCGDVIVKNIPTGIGTGYTGTLVEFDRKAESLEKAIESAMHDIEAVPDLHATGITIPAPERDEPSAEETDSDDSSAAAEPASALADPAGAESSADVHQGAKSEKKPAARKASTRKTGARKAVAPKAANQKAVTLKAGASKESANGQNGATGG
jgi:hypothetical protein